MSIGYALAASVWLIAADSILHFFVSGDEALRHAHWQALTGWLFIAGTTGLLYILVRHYLWIAARRELESEVRLKDRSLDAASSGVLICDVQHSECPIIYANAAFERMTGYRRDEILGRNPRFLQGADTDTASRDAISQALVDRRECRITIRNYRSDGTTFWNEMHLVPIPNERGVVTHYLGIQNDVTDRIRAEAALRQREQELWQIIDLVPHFIFAKDIEGRFLLANQAVAAAYGTTPQGLIGKADADFATSEEELLHFREDDLDVIRGGTAKHIPEETITDSQGRVHFLQTTKIPFVRAGSELPAVLGVSIDITERKRTEGALRQSELLFRRIFESPVFGILVWDTDGNIFDANDAFLRMVGYSREDLNVGLVNWADMTPPEYDQADRKAYGELQAQGFCAPFAKEFIRKDGTRFPVLLASSLVDGPGSRGISFVLDTTEQKQAEAALRTSEERYRRAISAAGAVPYERDYRMERFTFMGEGIEAITGYRADEVTPDIWNGIIQERIMRGEAAGLSVDEARQRALDGRLRLWQADVRIVTRTGEMRWLANTALQLFNEQGQVTGSLGILQDVTERVLFSNLGFELAATDTLDKVARTVQKAVLTLWNSDAFFVSIRKSGEANYQVLLKADTVDGRLTEQQQLEFYQAGGPPELASLYRGEPLLLNRKWHDEAPMKRFGPGSRPSASLMYAPMRTGQRIQGIVSVQSYVPERFTREDLLLLQRIADAAAPALERCRAETRGSAFLQLGERLSAAESPEEAARTIVAVADEVVGWDACLLYLYSEKEKRAYPLVRMDVIDGKRADVPADFSEIELRGNMRRVIEEQKGILILRQDLPALEEFEPFGDTSRPSASILWVPIRTPGGTIGLLSVQSYTINAYDEEDLDTLQALAGHCGGALERTRAQTSLREREERYRHAITEAGAVPYQLDYLTRAYVFVGEGIERVTGYTPEEFTVEQMRAMVIDVILRGETAGLSPREASGQIRQANVKEWRADICIRTRTGETCWLSDTSVQLLDEQGVPSGSLGILQDITERKRAEEALRDSEERYRRTITIAGAVPYQRNYSNEERFSFIGEGIRQITGYAPEELTFALWREIIEEVVMLGEAHELSEEEAVRRTRNGEIREWRCDLRVRTLAGEQRWLSDTSIQLLNDSGQPVGSLGILIDVTERKKAEQALRESEERYALAAEAANDGLWDWDLKNDSIYLGPRWLAMLGLSPDETSRSPEEWFRRIHPEDVDQVRSAISGHLTGDTSPHFEIEYRMLHQDGTYRWILCRGLAVRDAQGQAYRLAGSQTDVTERHIAQQQLLHDAFHDALTGLPNRALLMDRLEHVISRTRRRGDCAYAVMFIDLDRFKIINDSLGHLAGDLVLKTVARRLEECVRPGDTVARFAGDEFTILLEDLGDPSDTRIVADRIQQELSRSMDLEGQTVYTTVSTGIALGSPDYLSPDELLRDADNALYRAKAAGKARYEIFDPSMHAKAVAVLELETDLRRAVEQQELVLHYQPIVSLETGRITAFEALLRWSHPERGLIPPAAFIPMAEETGLIIPMGWWIVSEACRQLHEWTSAGISEVPLQMSINLSARQFTATHFAARLEQIVRASGASPDMIAFEITESVLMENPEAVAPQLEQLRALGFQLHLDDFGTGYSSFSYLHRFPISTLKIDRSFVSCMGATGKEADITFSIIQLARNLGMGVTAEGVETADQLLRLREMNCGCVQGYLISRPTTAAEAEALIARDPCW